MPGYSAEVHDIGLKLQEAIEEMGLETEPFAWPKNPPAKVVARLTDFEKLVFKGRHQRVELNAILPADRGGYIERKLVEAHATDKVVPTDTVLSDEARSAYETEMDQRVDAIVNDLLSVDEIKRTMRDAYTGAVLADPRAAVLAAFEEKLEQSWRNAIIDRTQTSIGEREDQLRKSITRRIVDALQE